MGIDRSGLFPGPDGLCERINWETKNRIARNFPLITAARVVYLQPQIGNPPISQTPPTRCHPTTSEVESPSQLTVRNCWLSIEISKGVAKNAFSSADGTRTLFVLDATTVVLV
jgi:hypothetical protein